MSRSAEFSMGTGVVPNTQTPAAPERRAGPLPYPQTYQDHLVDYRERERSRGQ